LNDIRLRIQYFLTKTKATTLQEAKNDLLQILVSKKVKLIAAEREKNKQEEENQKEDQKESSAIAKESEEDKDDAENEGGEPVSMVTKMLKDVYDNLTRTSDEIKLQDESSRVADPRLIGIDINNSIMQLRKDAIANALKMIKEKQPIKEDQETQVNIFKNIKKDRH